MVFGTAHSLLVYATPWTGKPLAERVAHIERLSGNTRAAAWSRRRAAEKFADERLPTREDLSVAE
jgi:hypothetical protein